DDDTLAGLDIHRAARMRHRNAEDFPRLGLLTDDALHLVTQKDLHALLACALLQPPDQPGTIAVAARRVNFVFVLPFHRDERPRHRRGGFRPDRLLDELDAVLDQEVEGRKILVGKDAHQIAVAVACDGGIVTYP